MKIRHAYRAGSFYDGTPGGCRRHASALVESAELPEDLPEPLYGGIVPHAGWFYSGRIAATTLKALLQTGPLPPETVILLGADHTGMVTQGEVFESGVWQTPLGDLEIDDELATRILDASNLFRTNPNAHAYEHSIEVQVPLLKVLCQDIRIVPIGVPPTPMAVEIGTQLARVIKDCGKTVVLVGSSDLTHHGGHFGNPGGRGLEGVEYSEKNDQRILDMIQKMRAAEVITEAAKHQNACGAGAIAATISACQALGATSGRLLEYTNSYRITHEMAPDSGDDTTVGYASVVFE